MGYYELYIKGDYIASLSVSQMLVKYSESDTMEKTEQGFRDGELIYIKVR